MQCVQGKYNEINHVLVRVVFLVQIYQPVKNKCIQLLEEDPDIPFKPELVIIPNTSNSVEHVIIP